jgi:hypothetical protein
MKTNSLGTIFGLVLLFALLAGGYYLFKYVTGVFSTLDPQLETLAGIASVVALVCAVIVAEGLKAGRSGDSVAEKARIYGELLFVCCERLRQGGEVDASTELARIEQSLALHGAARVIAAYGAFRRLTVQYEQQDDTAATHLLKLLTEMRADLGHAALVRNENELRDILLGRS